MLDLLLVRRKATAWGWRTSLHDVSFGYETRLCSNNHGVAQELIKGLFFVQ